MSLSECMKCGGFIPLGPDATNRCEKCGMHFWGATDPSGAPTGPPPAHAGEDEVGTVAHDYHRLCAASWKALGITEYTGRSIPEEIELLRARLTPSASAPVEVTSEMEERAVAAFNLAAESAHLSVRLNWQGDRAAMRAALAAALKGRT